MHTSGASRGPGAFAALLVSTLFATATADPNPWPNGADRMPMAAPPSASIPVQWDADHVRWKVKLPGKGSSSPIVWADRIYLTTPAEGQDAVMAFDFDGKTLWQTMLGPESPPKHRTLGSSSNASPVTDGEALYVYFKSGTLASLALDGKVRWQINLVERFGRDQLFWDQGTSPVLTDRHVVMARMHGGESWLAGFDKATGELSWQQPRNYKTPTENDNAYSTPVVFRHGNQAGPPGLGRRTSHRASGHDGKLLWSCGGFNPAGTEYWPAIATPGHRSMIPGHRARRTRRSPSPIPHPRRPTRWQRRCE